MPGHFPGCSFGLGNMDHVSNEQIRYCLNAISAYTLKAIPIFVYGKNVFEVRKEI